MEFFDSHAHLNDNKFKQDLAQVILRASSAQVKYILNVGYDLASSRQAVEIAKRYPGNFAAVGVHPHDASSYDDAVEHELEQLAAHPKVVAVGEMGLDFYRDLSPRDVQKKVFRRQIALAKKVNKPIIVHDRDAHQGVMEILKQEKVVDLGVVLHCFSGSPQMAKECIKLGWYISLAGPVTYPNALKPVQVAAEIPLASLLIETDCPYLSPQSVRGRRNEPSHVIQVAEKIAEIKGKPLAEIAGSTTENARKLFRI